MRFSAVAVVFRPAKKGAPSCVGTIPFGRACLADGLCLSLGRGIGGRRLGISEASGSCPALKGGATAKEHDLCLILGSLIGGRGLGMVGPSGNFENIK